MTPFTPEMVAAAQTGGTLVAVDGKTYPLESAAVTARAEGGFATTTLTQVYANPYDEPLEVQYTLPLPADGAVLGYTITIGERVIRARVEPREKADRQYKQALYEGRTAGLLEQSRPDTFQQRLGNVPPRTKVAIAIDVLHPLAFVPGEATAGAPVWEYRFPTVVGVRYHGGRTPDARELSPDRGDAGVPVEMSFTLRVGDELGSLARCSTHRAVVSRADDGAATLAFERGEALDRDIVARWDACAAEIGVRVAEGGGLEGDDGRYALVTVVPPAVPTRTWSRDVTLLLDTSGSMTGLPLDLAKRVASDLLRSLGEGDRFEVMEFSDRPRSLTHGVVAWNPATLERLLVDIDALQASGGTEMSSAVNAAMSRASGDAQRQVVLVTDGAISFESEAVSATGVAHNVRLHVVGVGSVPNRSLTQAMAAAGRGVEVLVGDERTAAEGARRLVAATAQPVLTGLSLEGIAVVRPRPSVLRDVFAGQPLVFTVELSRTGGPLELSGHLAGESSKWLHRIAVPAQGEASLEVSPLPLGALFGRQRIEELEHEGFRGDARHAGFRRSLETDALIEQAGMRHRIASRRTSLIAISEEVTVDPKQPRRTERLAVEVPYGVSAEGAGLHYPMAAAMPSSSDRMPRMAQRTEDAMSIEMIRELSTFKERRIGATRPVAKRLLDPITTHEVVWRSRHELVFVISASFASHGGPPMALELLLDDGRRVSAQLEVVGPATRRASEHGTEVRLLLPVGLEVTELSSCRCGDRGFGFHLQFPANRPAADA